MKDILTTNYVAIDESKLNPGVYTNHFCGDDICYFWILEIDGDRADVLKIILFRNEWHVSTEVWAGIIDENIWMRASVDKAVEVKAIARDTIATKIAEYEHKASLWRFKLNDINSKTETS